MPKEEILTGPAVIKIVSTYMGPEHVELVQKALTYAEKAHEGQVRQSGEPYIIHPIQVAGILAELHMDPHTVATGCCRRYGRNTGRFKRRIWRRHRNVSRWRNETRKN